VSTVTVVPTVDAASTPPRVQLAVTDTGTPSLFAVTVTRLNPDGSQGTVRTPDGNPLILVSQGTRTVTNGVTTASSTTVTSATAAFTSADVGATISGGSIPAGATIVSITSGTSVVISAAATVTASSVSITISGPNLGTVYDYEAPYGAPVSYSTQESPATISAEVTVPASSAWLTHPSVPALSMPIELQADSFAEEVWDVVQGVYWPMGRKAPVVQSDGQRKAVASSLTVSISTLADLASLRALLQDTSVLLLNVPATLGLGIDTAYISVGAVRNKRLTNIGSDPYRVVTLPIQVVDAPVGGTTAARTYADLLSFSTYAALNAAYPTYAALLAGP
jgi:phage baseplate assembly protein gpV